MSIRFLDMYSGIGGFRSGLENAGAFQCVGHCEIDKYTDMAYRAMYDCGGEYYCEDARKIKPDEMPGFDLICAGFPCQSFSVAGQRRGFNDTRGTLIFEVARIAQARKPSFLFLENVLGLLSHDSGRTFETVLSVFESMGYSLEWCVLNSANFGVPQQRRRLYIVGYNRAGCAGEIFPLAESPKEDLRQLIGGKQGQRVYSTDGSACTQAAEAGGWGGKTGLYFIDMNIDPVITDDARCITTRQDSGITKHRGEHSAVLIEDVPDEPVFTITAQDRHGALHRGRIRRLMPIECWRLQGFTDEQFNKAAALGLSDARLYKMAGNSVTVPVITAIGKKLLELNQKYKIVEG